MSTTTRAVQNLNKEKKKKIRQNKKVQELINETFHTRGSIKARVVLGLKLFPVFFLFASFVDISFAGKHLLSS